MNCKYCGAALPTKGGVCPECGRMIPMPQQIEMRKMLDPKWNEYRNMNTADYKKASNNDSYAGNSDAKVGKIIVIAIIVVIILIIMAATRSK